MARERWAAFSVKDHKDGAALVQTCSCMTGCFKGSIRPPTLWFNYRSRTTKVWENGAQRPGARYDVKYPPEGEEGIVVKL